MFLFSSYYYFSPWYVTTIAVVPVVSVPLCVQTVNARVSLKTVNVKSRQCKYNREADWNDALETTTMKHACGRCAKSSASDKNLQQLRVPFSPLRCEWKREEKEQAARGGGKQNKTQIKNGRQQTSPETKGKTSHLWKNIKRDRHAPPG